MAYFRCEWISEALDMATSAVVILPETGDLARTPVVYLLHGLSDNCTGWSRYTGVERYARNYGVAVVMPEVQRSFYCDTRSGMKYFTYISQELPKICRRFFGLSADPQYNYVMGLSMGGFGALKCALTNPQWYAGCASFSGALRPQASKVLSQAEADAIWGGGANAGPENDLFTLVADCQNPPPIFQTCGEQDGLYPVNQAFAEHLEKLGVTHVFTHGPGAHTWEFWDDSVRAAFDYFFGK